MSDDGWTVIGPNVRGRKCGSCTLCCTLLPVRSLGKPANTACRHLCSKGCGVYARRPFDCRHFSCRWLMDETTAGLRRPDKVGYVIDASTDTVLVEGEPIDVVQVWVDPDRPDAHEDEGLRSWLDKVGRRFGIPALIRNGSYDAWLLVPPSLTGGKWHEHRDSTSVSDENMADIRKAAFERLFGGGGEGA